MSEISPRTFYKTIIPFEVLSEEPLPDDRNLAEIYEATINGDCSGRTLPSTETKLNGKEAAEALMAQGSAPEFFRLNDDGSDVTR